MLKAPALGLAPARIPVREEAAKLTESVGGTALREKAAILFAQATEVTARKLKPSPGPEEMIPIAECYLIR